MGEKRLISHAEELQRMYADPLPSRRVIVTPHSTGVSFFEVCGLEGRVWRVASQWRWLTDAASAG